MVAANPVAPVAVGHALTCDASRPVTSRHGRLIISRSQVRVRGESENVQVDAMLTANHDRGGKPRGGLEAEIGC